MDIITTRSLHESGLSKHDITALVAAGELTRLKRGHYVREPPPTPALQHLALASTAPEAILALESAALAHGLPVDTIPEQVHCLVGGRGRSWDRGTRRVVSGPLSDASVVAVGGRRATSVARTVVDITRWRGLEAGLVPWEAALWKARLDGHVDVFDAELDAVLDELARHLGMTAARRARQIASAWSQSPQETRSRLLIMQMDLPQPVQQFEVLTAQGISLGFSDFAWPEYRLLGEYDGQDKYDYLRRPGEAPLDVLRREKARQEEMEAEGHRFVRWGKEEVARPVRLEAKIRRALMAQGWSAAIGDSRAAG